MSDLLTHWAVFDDCRRLAQIDPAIDPDLRDVIERERAIGRLGAITWKGRAWMEPVLANARARWSQRDRRTERAVAFVLGGLTHQACDRAMKPLLSAHADSDWDAAHHDMQAGIIADTAHASPHQDVSAIYDTFVLDAVYDHGDAEPFSRFLLASHATEADRLLGEFVDSLFQATLLGTHIASAGATGHPEPAPWLSSFQPLYLGTERWEQAWQTPDPAQRALFETETGFYRLDDPAVQAARLLQRGETVPAALAQAALSEGANQGGYGQALELGLIYLRRATAFWQGNADSLVAENVIRATSSGQVGASRADAPAR